MGAAESFAAIKVDVRDLPKAFEVTTEEVDTDIPLARRMDGQRHHCSEPKLCLIILTHYLNHPKAKTLSP
jgi:hypothetical protein